LSVLDERMSVEFHYPEIVGWGVALFDFKNDGKLDILLCKGRRWPPARGNVV